jgi:hypothetical protein
MIRKTQSSAGLPFSAFIMHITDINLIIPALVNSAKEFPSAEDAYIQRVKYKEGKKSGQCLSKEEV